MEWQRHRNIIATLFHGNINKVVWSETLNQASEMLHAWNRSGRAGTTGFLKDLRSLSLNILATAGFRKSYRFRTSTDAVVDEIRSYRKCLEIVLDNALLMMLLPPNLLSMFFIPKSLARIGQATTKLKQYMISAFNEERQLFDTGKPGAGNFMSSLVRALQNEQRQSMKGSGTKGLAMSEVLGNIFFINFAGHDTNVNTMAYGILLLAAHPEVQEWLGKEIEEVVQDSSSKTWDYGQIFPRLKRCQAVVVSRNVQSLLLSELS